MQDGKAARTRLVASRLVLARRLLADYIRFSASCQPFGGGGARWTEMKQARRTRRRVSPMQYGYVHVDSTDPITVFGLRA